jgi:hypothetical protein
MAGETFAELTLTKAHIGSTLAVRCTPVRQVDHAEGDAVTHAAAVVTPALPVLSSVSIVGDLVEGELLDLDGEYFGGDMADMEVVSAGGARHQ